MIYIPPKGRAVIVQILPKRLLDSDFIDVIHAAIETEISPINSIWHPIENWLEPESYKHEMGGPLTTEVLVLSETCGAQELATLKNKSIEIEEYYRFGGSRQVNINPGIAFSIGVLVASHKPKGKIRSSIGQNMWGQWVLEERDGIIQPASNTFDEYHKGDRLKRFRDLCVSVSGSPSYTS